MRDINGHTNSVIESPASTRNAKIHQETVPVQSLPTPEIVLEPINNGRIRYNRTNSNSPKHQSEVDKETTFSTFHTVETQVHTQPEVSKLDVNTSASSIERTHSGSSRQEWKEQMRKKHLPPFFTNDSFTADIEHTHTQQEQIVRSDGNSGSVHSLYYLSSDYHPDYLNTDSLPRHRILGLGNPNEVTNLQISPECDEIDTNLRSPNTCHKGNTQNGHESHTDSKLCTSPTNNHCHSNSKPVSADEIDIYIHQMASETNKQISHQSHENPERDQEIRSTYPNINDIREPAEGCNEEDEKQNYNDILQQSKSSSQESTVPQMSSNWTDIVEPILKKNETDDLDVSLTSCDPTWQQVKQYKLDRDRPASHSFDHETDKGFEEALSVEYEEYERSISSMTNESIGDSLDALNPFDLDNDFKNESFKTQAVVSKSRPASCSTVDSDNPFDYVPIETRRDVIKRSFSDNVNTQKPSFSTFKSSFTNSSNISSSHDLFGEPFGNDLSNGKTSTPNNNSPWPTIPEQSPDEENVFESDFASNVSINVPQKASICKSITSTETESNSDTKKEDSSGIIMDVAPVFL